MNGQQPPAQGQPQTPPSTQAPIQPAQTGKPDIKTHFWRWLWWFIWEDNSIWSWIVNIILAFVIIKFIVYPGLGLLLGTGFPIVAVVSGSMEHDGSFDQWWTSQCGGASQSELYAGYGVEKAEFEAFRFRNGFNKGDLMILRSAKEVTLGDVVVFPAPGLRDPIIHRAVAISDSTITTKGDHNCVSAPFEANLAQDVLLGKALFRLPYLGWIKIGFVELVNVFVGR